MRKERHIGESAEQKRRESRLHRLWTSSLVWGMASTLFLVLVEMSLSFLYYASKTAKPENFVISYSLLYFVSGIVLLGVVIVGIASFTSRKNREVILLKQRLAEIYLLAMKKSAL